MTSTSGKKTNCESALSTDQAPIFIIGAPRSGNTWLGKVLETHENIICWDETNNLWTFGNLDKPDDVLLAEDCNLWISRYIQQRFDSYLADKSAQRVCDKTPRNCLRVLMIKKVFPNAKFILLLRDGRSVINSTQKELHRNGEEPIHIFLKNQLAQTFRKLRQITIWEIPGLIPSAIFRIKRLMGLQLSYWGARPPGWKEWINNYPEHVLLAKQWSATIETAIELSQKLPVDSFLEIKYEDLMIYTEREIQKIASFLNLENAEDVVNYAIQTADPRRIDKWRSELDDAKLADIKDIVEPTMKKIGYSW